MQTFSLNSLAEAFEVDRSTMVRAIRHVPPDLVKPGNRSTWKTATAARALEAHRRPKNVSGNGGGLDPELTHLYTQFDTACENMAALPTLARRRAAAKALVPVLAHMDRRTRAVRIAKGEDETFVHLLADKLRFLYLRGFEAPVRWTMDECHDHLSEPWTDDE
jgi:hypothetical protein